MGFTRLCQSSLTLGVAIPPRDRLIQLSTMARRKTEELIKQGYSLEMLNPFFDGMAECYLAHAEDRNTLYRLGPDVEKSVKEAQQSLNVIAYIFYTKVLCLIHCTLRELEELDREYHLAGPRAVKTYEQWW